MNIWIKSDILYHHRRAGCYTVRLHLVKRHTGGLLIMIKSLLIHVHSTAITTWVFVALMVCLTYSFRWCSLHTALQNHIILTPKYYGKLCQYLGCWNTGFWCHHNITSHDIGYLTHWGRAMHICVSKLTIIGSDNGLSPGRRQAIIWANAGILLIGLIGTNVSDILIEILTFSFKKMRLKVSSVKWLPCCLGLNVLR